MTEYSHAVYSMTASPGPDGIEMVVDEVKWVMSAAAGELTAEYPLCTRLTAPADNFTPYDELTEETVLGWVLEQTPANQMEDARVWLEARLAAQMVPPSEEVPLPW